MHKKYKEQELECTKREVDLALLIKQLDLPTEGCRSSLCNKRVHKYQKQPLYPLRYGYTNPPKYSSFYGDCYQNPQDNEQNLQDISFSAVLLFA
jgi:hypothetical protein